MQQELLRYLAPLQVTMYNLAQALLGLVPHIRVQAHSLAGA